MTFFSLRLHTCEKRENNAYFIGLFTKLYEVIPIKGYRQVVQQIIRFQMIIKPPIFSMQLTHY